jgi:hypothetical protein
VLLYTVPYTVDLCMVAAAPEKLFKLIYLILISYTFWCVILSFGNNFAYLHSAKKKKAMREIS